MNAACWSIKDLDRPDDPEGRMQVGFGRTLTNALAGLHRWFSSRTTPEARGQNPDSKTQDRGIRHIFFGANKVTKLLKTQRSVPESDKTKPIWATFGDSRDSSKRGWGCRVLPRTTGEATLFPQLCSSARCRRQPRRAAGSRAGGRA